MTKYTFDTSFIIAHKVTDLPKNFLLSAIVVAELMASANDNSQRKVYEAMRLAHEKDDTLIVPISEDWLMASRVLYWLAKRRKRRAGGQLPPLVPGASQRMMLDTLIAVSAKRVGATVVTDNWGDFKAIQYYCDVKLRRGETFARV